MASFKKIAIVLVVAFFVAAVVDAVRRTVAIKQSPDATRSAVAIFLDVLKSKIS